MSAFRIAFAGAVAALAAPAAALATNADGATPTATPLLLELAVAALVVGGLLVRRRLASLARGSVQRIRAATGGYEDPGSPTGRVRSTASAAFAGRTRTDTAGRSSRRRR